MNQVLAFAMVYADLIKMTNEIIPYYDYKTKLIELKSLLEKYL